MRSRSRLLALVAAAMAALLLSGCSSRQVRLPWLGLAVRVPGASATPQPVALPPQASPPVATSPQSIEQFIPIAEHFVEVHRGMPFKTRVAVTLLGDDAFRQRLLGDPRNTQSDAELQKAAKELRALHLVSGPLDIGAATRDLLGAGVSGFYDAKSKSLVVRGVAASPYVRQVLVHELTHALQDQYFGIDRPDLEKADDERGLAFQSLVEGDAVRIETEYHESLSPAEQAAADREEQGQGGGIPASVPRVLIELIAFPYIAGPPFVRELVREGGNARLDDAFVHPPVDSAQLLDPTRFLANQQPVTVAVPRGDGTVFDKGVLGEFGLLLMIEHSATTEAATPRTVADMWGGDEYVAWDQGSQACMRIAVAAQSPQLQDDLDSALRDYAQSSSGVTLSTPSGAPATLTSCA